MRKLFLFCVAFTLIATSCNKAELMDQEAHRPVVPEGKANITITGDSMITTRSTNGRVEFAGGYATGAGLYDGDATAAVAAVPYSGYQLVNFTGGPTDGSSSQFSGSTQYNFPIQKRDWRFSVSFKKEYTITVNSGGNGSVSGGGTILEGENCTVSAYANAGYIFDGWYEGANKVSSSANYTFTVSSNRTIHRFMV